MPKKAETKNEVELDTNTLSDAERESLDVKNHDSSIRLQTKGVYFGLIVLLVAAVAAGLFWFIGGWDKDKIAFTVDGKKFYKKDVKVLQDEAAKDNISSEDALNIIKEAEKHTAAAVKLGIKVGDDKYDDASSQWRRTLGYKDALKSEAAMLKTGGYTVAVYYLPFSRLQMPLSGIYDGKAKPTDYRDPVAVAADRTYAQEKASYFQNELSSGKLKNEKAVEQIRADERLVAGPSTNRSGIHRIDNSGNTYVAGDIRKVDEDGWMDQIKGMQAGQQTSLGTGKIVLFDLPDRPTVDGYFYFVRLASVNEPKPNIEKQLQDAINSVRVR